MSLSVLQNRNGPLWPLGLITVAASGTPVGLMSLVDSSSYNAPETATSTHTAEYASAQACDIIITPTKSIAPVTANTGAIYLLLVGTGSNNKTDSGVIVLTIATSSGPVHLSTVISRLQAKFDAYQMYLDADNSGDGALVTLVI
jgi:hypothetical protein